MTFMNCTFAVGNAVHPEGCPENKKIISDLKSTSFKISCRLEAIKIRHLQELRKLAAKSNDKIVKGKVKPKGGVKVSGQIM